MVKILTRRGRCPWAAAVAETFVVSLPPWISLLWYRLLQLQRVSDQTILHMGDISWDLFDVCTIKKEIIQGKGRLSYVQLLI